MMSLGSSLGSIQGIRDNSLEAEAREDAYKSVIDGFISSGKGKQLKILVVGEAGQGKSTLINALVGKEVAKEGDCFVAGTSKPHQYCLKQNGVEIEIWDTPGFGLESEEEEESLMGNLKMSFDCHLPDLVLFCIRMDQTRIPTRVHIDTIIKFTKAFGDEFWKHALFILTFANNIAQMCPEEIRLEQFFSQRCEKIEEQLRNTLEKNSRLNTEQLAEVRVVPVGSCKKGLYPKNPWALPDREDWFIFFWIDVANRLPLSAQSAILQMNRHRMVDDAHMSAEVEPFQRKLEATAEEIEKVKKESLLSLAVESSAHSDDHGELPSGHFDDLNNPPQPHPKRPCATEDRSNEGKKPIHDRMIPVHVILLKQLNQEDSGFKTYATAFASKRGEELKLVGHLIGFFEGMFTYLRKKTQTTQ